MKFIRKLSQVCLLGALTLLSTGCAEMVIGGAVVGVFAATDRRTLGAQTEDKTIAFKGERRAEEISKISHVNVNSFNRRVLLTGEVPNQKTKDLIASETAKIEGVSMVVNELLIGGVSSLSSRSSDAIITTKVKATFVDAKDIFANSFKVVTERGNVYLMGRVTEREANRAVELARGVSGVFKVVRVFEIISEEELRQMSGKTTARN